MIEPGSDGTRRIRSADDKRPTETPGKSDRSVPEVTIDETDRDGGPRTPCDRERRAGTCRKLRLRRRRELFTEGVPPDGCYARAAPHCSDRPGRDRPT